MITASVGSAVIEKQNCSPAGAQLSLDYYMVGRQNTAVHFVVERKTFDPKKSKHSRRNNHIQYSFQLDYND